MELEFHGDFLGHAQNLWRRFPEVFEVLGAPGLEDGLGAAAEGRCGERASDNNRRSIIEAVLPWSGAGILGGVADSPGVTGSEEPKCGKLADAGGGDGASARAGRTAWQRSPEVPETPGEPTRSAAPAASRLALRRGFAVAPIKTREARAEDGERIERRCSEASEAGSEESMGTLIERIAVRHPMGVALSLADGSPCRELWPAPAEELGAWQGQAQQLQQQQLEWQDREREPDTERQQNSWWSMWASGGR